MDKQCRFLNNLYPRKELRIKTACVTHETMDSALKAADAFAEAQEMSSTLIGNCVDGTIDTRVTDSKKAMLPGLSDYGEIVTETGSWLLSGTAAVAEVAATKLFGSSEDAAVEAAEDSQDNLPDEKDVEIKQLQQDKKSYLERIVSRRTC